MGQTNRPMPVRADHWRPEDRVLDTIIRRCAADADSAEDGAGSSTYMAGGMVVAVLAVLILIGSGSAQAAIIIPGVLALLGVFYVLSTAGPAEADRSNALREVGGAGGLPAGYLVHPDAWAAGMAEHVAYTPESQLQAAVQLSRNFPGTVDDLLGFTATIAAQLPPTRHATAADVEKRTKELVRVGAPILRNHALTTGK
jgi:hypothetical protein